MPQGSYLDRPWRQGRKVPRHIYAMLGSEPANGDPEIAVAIGLDASADAIAYMIVTDHNRELERRERE